MNRKHRYISTHYRNASSLDEILARHSQPPASWTSLIYPTILFLGISMLICSIVYTFLL